MIRSLTKNMSLKTKVSLTVTFLFAFFVIAASYFTLSYFERQFKETISTQQFSLVSNLATNIDDKLRIAQNSLIVVAPSVPRDAWANVNSAQQFLDARIGLKSIFDNVVFLMSKEGGLIAESPYKPGRRGKDLSFRDFYKGALSTGKPYISSPFISTYRPDHPSINMTVPIFDDRGNLLGFLGGGVNLLGKNFLAELSNTRIGKYGYLFVTDSNRVVISHPDKNRIMKLAASPGANKLYDRAIDGFEGSGETVTSGMTPVISSYKRLGMTPWILACSYPTSEAYAPLHKAKHYFDVVAVAATAMMLLIIWFVVKRIMSPLAVVTRHLEYLADKSGEQRHIVVDATDEIGILATTFNSMIDTLDSQREELRRQNKKIEDERIMLEKEIDEKHQVQEILIVKKQMLEELNRLLEDRIAEAVADLRQKDQILIQQSRHAAMGEMISNIAHQWRQPLNNLGLIVQNLQMVFEMGQLELEEMNSQSDRAMEIILFMSSTIDDFRNYFRQNKEKVQFNVEQIVARTISIIEGSLNSQQVNIEINTTDDPVIYGYPNEYSQVLLNILINARDAFSERSISDPRIVINIRKENGKAVVTITDNGGGIPENVIDKVFDPYFTTKGPDKGTGIGLFMSKVIIEKSMDGRLTTRNIEGGAEFRIEV